jgi:hypothetical protein
MHGERRRVAGVGLYGGPLPMLRSAVVVVEQAAETFAAVDFATPLTNWLFGADESVADSVTPPEPPPESATHVIS